MDININLRDEFHEIMQNYGHYILIQRTGRSIRCSCWSEKYQEAEPECSLCGGTGWLSRIERHLTRKESASQIISKPNLRQQNPTGKTWIDTHHFYFYHNVHPQVGDYIYEVGWSGHKPTHLSRMYMINDIDPLRGDNGRIEYWTASAKAETINVDLKEQLIYQLGPIKNYDIV